MDSASNIREARRLQGLTQTELAYRSGVSLPTIQNMETGRANPTLVTLNAVLGVLGLELRSEPRGADWDELVRCGAPLMIGEGPTADGQENRIIRESHRGPTPDLLLKNLRDACLELRHVSGTTDLDRKRDVVQALVLAIRSHFPTFYGKNVAGIELYEQHLSAPVTGRTIRLAREAVANLARYL
jgi:transcriptional regulator with XRE-family HTH domain